ncbi:MAG: hypothetical protein KKE86_11665 [Planctomycetes bacterium]|nr:hypothetical protein [Planctomycetota bacterium]MBU4399978.1 hypothetical protein [Planctomycetota bacterium]MCG2685365.1 hypothetical protein [Planctomycetales bacterium]
MNTQTAFHSISSAELAAMTFPPQSPEPARVPAWGELVALEPALADVERMALDLHPRHPRPGLPDVFDYGDGLDVRDWGKIKRTFLPLAGFGARRYALRNSVCYDVAYDYLLACWENGHRP